MDYQDKIEDTIVYKQKSAGEDRGIVIPLLSVANDEFKIIPKDNYPKGIYVSQGYSHIENTYDYDQLFLLKAHYFDQDKTIQENSNRYWTKGDLVSPLAPDEFVPILELSLPDVSHGCLPQDFALSLPKRQFFIKDIHTAELYGPLVIDNPMDMDKKYRISPYIGDILRVYQVKDLSDCIYSVDINGFIKEYLLSLKELDSKKYTMIDYICDSKLIQYFNNQALGKNNRFLAKREAAKLQEEIVNFERKNLNTHQGKERVERLKKILDQYLTATDMGPQLIKEYLESPKGKNFLEVYVSNNESNLLQDQLKKIEQDVKNRESELNIKVQSLEKQMLKKQAEVQDIHRLVDQARLDVQKELELIEQETEELRRQKLKEKEEKLQGEIEALETKKEIKEKELSGILSSLNIANDLHAMNNRKIFLEENEKLLTQANKGLQETLQNPENLSRRMSEMEIVSKVLKGGNILQDNKPAYLPLDFVKTEPTSAMSIVESVMKSFDLDSGKLFSEAETANLLVSISQSFLTVIAGCPGVGKTSAVVRLANALRLGSPKEHRNFLYMSVARGWVSSRDILGFYNSLNNTYQRSRTGLFNFLSCPIDEANNSLRLILLDEANLSPMEHYWSDFLGMCDKEGRERAIDTGIPNSEQRELYINRNTRFIATINNDATTERLSPRLIDRVPVIYFDQDDFTNQNDFLVTEELAGALDYSIFEKYFVCNDAELDSFYENKLNHILDILKERHIELGQSITISHRKRLLITNYCHTMMQNNLMEADMAFDFAISQHVLPHIEGYGNKFKNRIHKLQSELGATYPRSLKHLERIIANGSDFTGSYSFF